MLSFLRPQCTTIYRLTRLNVQYSEVESRAALAVHGSNAERLSDQRVPFCLRRYAEP